MQTDRTVDRSWLTIPEVCRRVNLSRQAVWQRFKSGRLPARLIEPVIHVAGSR